MILPPPRLFLIRLWCLIALAASPVRASEGVGDWLVGHWKSNKELTVATLKLEREVPADLRMKFNNLFGRMTLTFTPFEMTSHMPASEKSPAQTTTEEYWIVAEVKNNVFIKSRNTATKAEDSSVMHFEGRDRFWLDLSTQGLKGREYFDRIPDGATKAPPVAPAKSQSK